MSRLETRSRSSGARGARRFRAMLVGKILYECCRCLQDVHPRRRERVCDAVRRRASILVDVYDFLEFFFIFFARRILVVEGELRLTRWFAANRVVA